MVVNNIKNQLISLGFSDYEAKAYVALLRIQPATAYELSKEAAVPSSKIYETLSRLTDKGIAQPVEGVGKRGQRYGALDPEEFLDHYLHEITEKTRRLSPLLRQLNSGKKVGYLWPLNTEEALFSKGKRMIASAHRTLLLSLWPEEFEHFWDPLKEAEQRGVSIALVHFGRPERRVGATYYHPAEKTIYHEKGGRGLTLVADSEEALIATFFSTGGIEASWSGNPTFVTVAEDYIRHDVYITKVTTLMDETIRERFGNNYEKLRDIFLPPEE